MTSSHGTSRHQHPGSRMTEPHLCQPDHNKSCAWCCGLYQIEGKTRQDLASLLHARTACFARTPRTVGHIIAYAEQRRQQEGLLFLDPDFYSCEFIGFLDKESRLVGCLLNPLAQGNGGIDWRGLSYHGGAACSKYFCAGFRKLSVLQKRIVVRAIQDWYLYGLVVPGIAYILSFFRLFAIFTHQKVHLNQLLSPSALSYVRQFFGWKLDWPYRSSAPSGGCLYSGPIDRAAHDSSCAIATDTYTASVETVFHCLDSTFPSAQAKKEAQEQLETFFIRLKKVLAEQEANSPFGTTGELTT